MTVTPRLAERADAAAIRAIYNPEVRESTVTFDLVPRSLDEQIAWIDAHSGGHPAVVAVGPENEVVGFGSLSTCIAIGGDAASVWWSWRSSSGSPVRTGSTP
jgi:L-amino acid N-acyltransferase YncA